MCLPLFYRLSDREKFNFKYKSGVRQDRAHAFPLTVGNILGTIQFGLAAALP